MTSTATTESEKQEMKFYVDSSDQDTVVGLLEDGLVTGVTSNPMILSRSGLGDQDIPRLHDAYVAAGAREILFQAWGTSTENLVKTGRFINELSKTTTVKVGSTREGFKAARILVDEGVPVLLTAIHTLPQALLAASIGPKYITPFIGRLNEDSYDGYRIAEQIADLYRGEPTEVLIGSVRNALDIQRIALVGHRHFTAGPEVIEQLVSSRMTTDIADRFEELAIEFHKE